MTDDELRQLVSSNARAIQALSDSIAELTNDRLEAQRVAQTERAELRQAMIGIANLVSALDSDRPTILRKLNSIEGKVDRILEQGEDAD
ncbi:MAG: hypothetical protein VKL39_13910 [Leptolyngbyaceae bacterium]|nr:hypothetical protein [Leptolyngbyaceae bacterium]